MTSFAAAYLIVWGFVALYVLRLRTTQQQLSERIEQLEEMLGERVDRSDHAEAA